MQAAMDRLTAILERRRWLVIAALARAAGRRRPFAARQTEHLTSGGFAVPGSGSEAVDRALADFEGAQRETLAVVVARRAGALRRRRARRRSTASTASPRELPHVELSDRAAAAGQAQARPSRPIVIVAARRAAAPRTRPPTWPSTCARSSASGEGAARRRRDLPGRPAGAVGRHAGPLQGGPGGGRGHRLPDRAADPARRVRLAGRRRAAAGAGLRQRDASPARSSTSSPRPSTCRCS